MTEQNRWPRRVAAVAGMGAIVAMGALTAGCSSEEEQAPETTTTTTATTSAPAAPVSPTEKAPRIDPGQPNPFSPTVHAPPAQGPTPGRHHGPRGQ